MKVIVTGSRDYWSEIVLRRELDLVHSKTPITLLIHGCAKGADTLADNWAGDRGVKVDPFPADWSRFGKAAGTKRNIAMLEAHLDAGLVLAFPMPKSVGTWHCVREAEKRSIPTKVIPF